MVDFGNNIGSEQNGIRPAIVLNKPHKKERTCVVVPASNTPRRYSLQVATYRFLIHQIRVVDITRFIRRVNRLDKSDTNQVFTKVCSFLE